MEACRWNLLTPDPGRRVRARALTVSGYLGIQAAQGGERNGSRYALANQLRYPMLLNVTHSQHSLWFIELSSFGHPSAHPLSSQGKESKQYTRAKYEYISTKSRDVAHRLPNLLFETNLKILLSTGMYE